MHQRLARWVSPTKIPQGIPPQEHAQTQNDISPVTSAIRLVPPSGFLIGNPA